MPNSIDKSIPFIASPNVSDRENHIIEGVVVHYTAGLHSIGWMQNPLSRVSAHFLIARDGTCTQMVDLKEAAWHAGSSAMPYRGHMNRNPNAFTIGIELENLGLLTKGQDGKYYAEVGNGLVPYTAEGAPVLAQLHFSDGHAVSGYWEPFYEPQMEKLVWLMERLYEMYPILAQRPNLFGHNEICQPVGRKIDPGPVFDWSRLRKFRDTSKLLCKANLATEPVA